MAPKTQPPKPVEDTFKTLKIETPPSPNLVETHLAASAAVKDRSPSSMSSCISSSGDASCSVKETDVDQESLMADQTSFYYPATPTTTTSGYYGYYYPGYEASLEEFDDQGYYYSGDASDVQYPTAMQGDGSLVYYTPGFQPGYVPYSPYLPGATVGLDGQYLSQQSYYLSPMSQQPVASSGYFTNSFPYGSDVMPSYLWDPSLSAADPTHGNGYGEVPLVSGYGPNFSAPSHTFAPSKSIPPSKPNNLEMKRSLPVLDDVSTVKEVKPVNKANAVPTKGYFPMAKLPVSNQGKSGLLYPNSAVNLKANGRGWSGLEKPKTRGKANGINEFDLVNEQNRGPRTNTTKIAFGYGVDPAGPAVTKGIESSNNTIGIIKRDQYNVPDFPSKYDYALFFVIKSYSEDDIHKSIKYNVWASTPNGNKRLDSAYQEAQEKMAQKGNKCPVFLFFSVNASGQFCGVAEMVGRVDFEKNMDFWQQDKWNGFFPLKWHIIKDVPNPHFRHIILENNDNKPVTNSRDTQEVRFPEGVEMLNIFKNYALKTSILDDFAFYESREKAMQDKRIRAPLPRMGHLQQKLDEVVQLAADLDLSGKKHNELAGMRDAAAGKA